jgi:hypothetical protein
MVIFACLDNNDIAGLYWIVHAVDGNYALALDKNEDFIRVVNVPGFRVGSFAGFEDVHAAVADDFIAQQVREQACVIVVYIG